MVSVIFTPGTVFLWTTTYLLGRGVYIKDTHKHLFPSLMLWSNLKTEPDRVAFDSIFRQFFSWCGRIAGRMARMQNGERLWSWSGSVQTQLPRSWAEWPCKWLLENHCLDTSVCSFIYRKHFLKDLNNTYVVISTHCTWHIVLSFLALSFSLESENVWVTMRRPSGLPMICQLDNLVLYLCNRFWSIKSSSVPYKWGNRWGFGRDFPLWNERVVRRKVVFGTRLFRSSLSPAALWARWREQKCYVKSRLKTAGLGSGPHLIVGQPWEPYWVIHWTGI